MSNTRREMLVGTAATAASLAAGTSPSRAAITAGKPFAGKEVKVLAVVATQFAAHAKRSSAFTDQTGIKTTWITVPYGALNERLTAEMVGQSDDFDVVTVQDVWIPPLVDKFLMPIDKMIADRKIDMNRYPAAFRSAGFIKDKVYGLPNRCHIQLLWYRKDLFAKAGLEPPKTWPELATTAKKMQDANPGLAGVTIPYGKPDGQNLMVWYNYLWGRGGDLFDKSLKPIFNSPEGIQATKDYVALILQDKVVPAGAASFNEADATTAFVQGKATMDPVWWHIYNRFVQADSAVKIDQIGFTPLPSYAGKGPTTYTNQWIYGVNTNSKNKDAAYEFLDFITQPEIERSILIDPTENDVVAVHWTNLRDPDVNKRFNGMHGIAAKALETTTQTIPNIPEFLQVMNILAAEMSDIARGAKSVEDGLNAAATQSTRVMRRAG